jgi:hypothetical protein
MMMNMFRGRKTSMAKLQNKLGALRKRGAALSEKLAAAEAELTTATEARQRQLVEGDLEDIKAARALQDAVNAAASQVVGFEDALAAVNAQISEIERKIEIERTAAERAVAADALSRNLDAIEAALPDYLATAHRFAEAVEAVGHFHFESAQMAALTRNTQAQIEIAGAFALQELRGMVEQIKTGAAPIPPKPEHPAPVAVPEPTPEIRRMFAMRVVRWVDAQGVQQVADQYTDVDLTPGAASRGLRCAAVVPLDDPRCNGLRGLHGGRHPNPQNALDLDDEAACRPAHIDPVRSSDPTASIEPTRVQVDPVTGVQFVEYSRGPARILKVTS